jgi:hypothetical protein
MAYRAVDDYVYERTRHFLRRRHKVRTRGSRPSALDGRPVLAGSLHVALELRARVRLRRVDADEPRPLLVAVGEAQRTVSPSDTRSTVTVERPGGVAGETQEAEAGAPQRAASKTRTAMPNPTRDLTMLGIVPQVGRRDATSRRRPERARQGGQTKPLCACSTALPAPPPRARAAA